MNIRSLHRGAGLLALALSLVACGGSPEPAAEPPAATPPAAASTPATVVLAPADQFLDALRTLCGQAFEGRISANEPPSDGTDPFDGKILVMHVRECGERELKIPFHVGDDRSRTWVLTRTEAGLRLKHDHRHADGSPDAVTLYGGDTARRGSDTRQEFPADDASIALFKANDLPASVTNTWALEIETGRRFVYELGRPGRLFRVEFDLTRPVGTPPPPWGAEGG